jgi:hypothetical protein
MKKLCGKNQDAGHAALGNKRKIMAISGLRSITGTSQTRRWVGIIVVMTALLLGGAGVGHAWGGGHGFGGHGFHHGFHHFGRFHGFGGARIGIGIGPFWGPYWDPYAYPPVVVQSPPPVVVQPSPPQASWYHCDNPEGYYPYVQQCPGGWRPVAPTPSR